MTLSTSNHLCSNIQSKPKVLIFIKHFEPGFRAGGPIRSISNLMQALGDQIDFYIVTLDRDIGETRSFPGISPNIWTRRNNYHIIYISPSNLSAWQIYREIASKKPSAIYLNSFFDLTFTQRVLLIRFLGLTRHIRHVLAPRGELSPGALSIKSFKKNLFIKFSKVIRLHSKIDWHATSELEATDLIKIVKSSGDIYVAENIGTSVESSVDTQTSPINIQTPLRICFLSRISPKKNLDFALEVLARINHDVIFSVYGPIEDHIYWKQCKALADRLPSNVRFAYCGEVVPSDVHRTFERHDIFLFPTKGENFGHVICEALCAGLPVLISDQTPWRDLPLMGGGWDIPLENPEKFVDVINNLSQLTKTELNSLKIAAKKFGDSKATSIAEIEKSKALFVGRKSDSHPKASVNQQP